MMMGLRSRGPSPYFALGAKLRFMIKLHVKYLLHTTRWSYIVYMLTLNVLGQSESSMLVTN